jgi:crotonobetainyl-CoA:carnitine CoA-transferase CaiB-like acyl-CoA transferase
LVDDMFNATLKQDVTEAWLDKLKAAGIPCGRINSVKQALDEPHTQARQMVETIPHPTVGALRMLGIPFKFSDTPAAVRCAPPLLGEHTDEILRQDLGLDAAAVAALREKKVI